MHQHARLLTPKTPTPPNRHLLEGRSSRLHQGYLQRYGTTNEQMAPWPCNGYNLPWNTVNGMSQETANKFRLFAMLSILLSFHDIVILPLLPGGKDLPGHRQNPTPHHRHEAGRSRPVPEQSAGPGRPAASGPWSLRPPCQMWCESGTPATAAATHAQLSQWTLELEAFMSDVVRVRKPCNIISRSGQPGLHVRSGAPHHSAGCSCPASKVDPGA